MRNRLEAAKELLICRKMQDNARDHQPDGRHTRSDGVAKTHAFLQLTWRSTLRVKRDRKIAHDHQN
jgi:hypothetical protein